MISKTMVGYWLLIGLIAAYLDRNDIFILFTFRSPQIMAASDFYSQPFSVRKFVRFTNAELELDSTCRFELDDGWRFTPIVPARWNHNEATKILLKLSVQEFKDLQASQHTASAQTLVTSLSTTAVNSKSAFELRSQKFLPMADGAFEGIIAPVDMFGTTVGSPAQIHVDDNYYIMSPHDRPTIQLLARNLFLCFFVAWVFGSISAIAIALFLQGSASGLLYLLPALLTTNRKRFKSERRRRS